MTKRSQKTFDLADPHHLDEVDKWWAGLLKTSPKAITSVKWEALGNLRWKLTLGWEEVDGDFSMDIGMPNFAHLSDDEVDELKFMALDDFEALVVEHHALGERVEAWEIREERHERGGTQVCVREDLEGVDLIIALRFVWPEYKALDKAIRSLVVYMRELETESQNRKSSGFQVVSVDRGMLRKNFIEQVGHDNEYLFEDFLIEEE